jgi:hypothetical protein
MLAVSVDCSDTPDSNSSPMTVTFLELGGPQRVTKITYSREKSRTVPTNEENPAAPRRAVGLWFNPSAPT